MTRPCCIALNQAIKGLFYKLPKGLKAVSGKAAQDHTGRGHVTTY
jgi:hypothetical protein